MANECISVIIVTWNSLETIKDCLDSVFNQKNVTTKILVIDNGSTDGTRDLLKSHYPQVEVVNNETNTGYSKANNQGINSSEGAYVVLLNADAVLAHEDCLNEFLKCIRQHPGVGSISGKVLKFNGDTPLIDSTGIVLNRKTFSPADRGEGQSDTGQFDKQEYIFGVSGAAAFYSRNMLDQISVENEIFDEDFFAYYEDVDLAWRAQLYGWKCMYIPEAVIYHFRKGPKAQNRSVYVHSFKNRYLCYIKNESLKGFLEFVPFNIGYEMLRCAKRFILEPYLIKSIFLAAGILPKMLKKRSIVQKHRRVDNEYMKRFD